MNSEKNIQPEERKKEHTSVLEKIRRRTGLLVGIVGLALVIFILESLLGSGASIFGGDEMSSAGTINGKRIDRNEFVMRLENQLNNYRQRNQGKEVDDATRSQALESVWQQYIIDLVMKPQFEKIGIVIGEDELYDAVVVNPVQTIVQNLTDPNTGRVNEQFSRPDGSLDPIKWKQAVQNVTGENEMAVRQMEEQVKSTRYFEKFRSLVNKGLYVTKAEAQLAFKKTHSHYDVSFVAKRFEDISDSAVKFDDSDLEKYYKDHSYEFKNPETIRKIEYVTFNVLPSAEDLTAVEAEANRIAKEFQGKTQAEDSSIMSVENEGGNIIIQNYTKKTMVVRDSSIYKAAPGTVFGPYNEGAYFKIYKLEAVNSLADSAKVRHILIGTVDPQTQQPKKPAAQAKREADSLLTLIKEKKVSFDTLVKTVSDDAGSVAMGGDYGWWGEEANWVPSFKNAGLKGTKGNISVVESQFGYHIIEVLDVSKTRHNSYSVAQVMKLIAPSEETTQRMFAKANEFAGENNTAEAFDKAVEKEKLTKRVADNLKEGDYQVPGLDNAKELVKWTYSANKGDVSLFNFSDRFVVAKLAGIKNKGVLPLEEVKEEVAVKVRKDKKAEMITKNFNDANAKNLQELANKMKVEVINQPAMEYAQAMVERIGQDNVLVGAVAGSKQGAMSKPLVGNVAVYAYVVNAIRTDPAPANYDAEKTDAERMLSSRTDYEVFNALKEVADIEFHKSRID